MSNKFTFFWREDEKNGVFSQWYTSDKQFWSDPDQLYFNCTEQYMMYHKAKLFGDNDIASKIILESSPKKQKKLGRQVKNYVEKIWIQKRVQIISQGNYLKFSQNEHLKKKLLQTKGTELVEASPYDKIYGIGFTSDQPEAQSKADWKGLNLLGDILTELRAKL